jgi:hypothetical protein
MKYMAMPPEPHNSLPPLVDQYGVRYTTAPSVPTVHQGEIVTGIQQLTGQTMAMPPEFHNSVPATIDQYGVRRHTAPSVPAMQQGEIVTGIQQLTGQTMAMPPEPQDSVPALVDQYGVLRHTAPSVPTVQQGDIVPGSQQLIHSAEDGKYYMRYKEHVQVLCPPACENASTTSSGVHPAAGIRSQLLYSMEDGKFYRKYTEVQEVSSSNYFSVATHDTTSIQEKAEDGQGFIPTVKIATMPACAESQACSSTAEPMLVRKPAENAEGLPVHVLPFDSTEFSKPLDAPDVRSQMLCILVFQPMLRSKTWIMMEGATRDCGV